MLLVQIPVVQKKMAKQFSAWIEQEYQIQIQADKIKLGILGGLQWEEVLLLDSQHDTLLYVGEVKIQASNLSFTHFQKVYLEGLVLHYQYQDSLSDAEFYRLLDPLLSSNEPSKAILIDHFWINGANVDFGNQTDRRLFRELDLYLKDCRLSSDTEFVLSSLDWEMLKGAKHQLEADRVQLSQKGTIIDGFNWESGNSLVKFDLNQNKLNNSSVLKIHNFKIDKEATQGLFDQWPNALQCDVRTTIYTQGDSLWTENIKMSSDKGSLLSGAFGLQNWSDFKRWKYAIQADTFNLAAEEWPWIRSIFPNDYLLSRLGRIESEAHIKGTLSDLNLNLSVDSDQGAFRSDVYINVADTLDAPVYKGNLILSRFNLASFISTYDFRTVDAEIFIDGKGFDLLSFDTNIHGEVSSIGIRNYTYENIVLDGRLQPNYFKGEAVVTDKNLEVDFSGEIDFAKEKPVMDFVADIIEADLVQLKWYDKEPVAKLSSLVEMNLAGDRWSNIEGSLGIYYTTIETYDNYYYFNDIRFRSEKSEKKDLFRLTSDFINANLEGSIDVPNLFNSFSAYLSPHLPLLKPGVDKTQNFDFDIDLFNTSAFTELLLPQLNLGDGAHISGSFNNREEGLSLDLQSPNLGWNKWLWRDLKLNSKATSEHWEISLQGAKLDYNDVTKVENIELDQVGNYGDWRYALAWTSTDSLKFDGILKGSAHVDSKSLDMALDESQFYFADTLWTLNDRSNFYYADKKFNSQVYLNTSSQELDFSFAGTMLNNRIDMELKDFEIDNLSPWLSRARSTVVGKMNGKLDLVKNSLTTQVYSDIFTNELIVNEELFGALNLDLHYDDSQHVQNIKGEVYKGAEKSLAFTGAYMPQADTNNFNVDMDVHHFNLKHLQGYLSVFDNLEGDGNGYLNFYGDLFQPEFEGELILDDVSLSVPYLNIDLNATGTSKLQLSDSYIDLKDFDFESLENGVSIGRGIVQGEFIHHNFNDFKLDLSLHADSLLCLNTDAYRDEAYYGRAVVSGDVRFIGPANAVDIEINAVSDKGTTLFIPLDDHESIDELSFVHFIEKDENLDTLWTISEIVKSKSDLIIDMNFELNENAQVNIIFDETLGDKLRATGNGFINLGINSANEVYMFGDYKVNEGDYLFTLQDFVNKKFQIEKGAQLSWDGSPYKAKMNLNALYKLNTNFKALTTDSLYNRNSDVECRMMMTGDLLQPEIEFDIQIPKGDYEIKRILEERTNTEEKKTQQFLSLLVLNSFMSDNEYENTDVDYLSSTVSSGAEMLNNQLYNWTSQFTDRFDLGLKYHPSTGEYLSNKQWELLLNNMKVNDRITFNGNIGTQPAQNTTRIIGDFKVEYQLNKDGKLRLLAFRNLEESFQLDYDETYTTGLGLFYRDEFDDFYDMWQKFKGMLRNKN